MHTYSICLICATRLEMAHHDELVQSLDGHYNIHSTSMFSVSIDRHQHLLDGTQLQLYLVVL